MAELVRCPACGCGVQVADTLLGRRVRCFGCQRPFVAAPNPPASPPSPAPPPGPPKGQGERWFSSPVEEGWDEGDNRPFCPGCGRRIAWRELRCPYCGEELEAEDDAARGRRRGLDFIRRDYEPHRGGIIVLLGNLSMIIGGLSLCLFGFGSIISVPLGVLAWAMANRDLAMMREGRMDPRGKTLTETGRTGAIAGILLGIIFAAFYGFLYLAG